MEKIFLDDFRIVSEPKKKEKSRLPGPINPTKWKEASKGANSPVLKGKSLRDKYNNLLTEEPEIEVDASEIDSPLALFQSLAKNRSKRNQKPAPSLISKKAAIENENEVEASYDKESSFSQGEEDRDENSTLFQKPAAKVAFEIDFSKSDSEIKVESPSPATFKPEPKLQLKLHQLAEKLIEKLNFLKESGRTEISLTFKSSNSSLFSEAKLLLTEFDSAKGEFSIRFENLSSKAHALVTNSMNQDILKESLNQKGFTFHYIVASTSEIESTASSQDQKEDSNFNHKEDEEELN